MRKNSVILLLLEQLIQSGIWIPKLVQYNLLFLFSLGLVPRWVSGRTDVLTQRTGVQLPRGKTCQVSSGRRKLPQQDKKIKQLGLVWWKNLESDTLSLLDVGSPKGSDTSVIIVTASICIGTCANQHHLHHHHSHHHHQLHRHPHRRHRQHGAVTLWSPRWLETSPLMSQGTKLTRRWHRANQRWNNSLEYKILSSENSILVCFARLVSLLIILELWLWLRWVTYV